MDDIERLLFLCVKLNINFESLSHTQQTFFSHKTFFLGRRAIDFYFISCRICTLLMIFSNTGAGGYPMFTHIAWDGLYLIDFIMSW